MSSSIIRNKYTNQARSLAETYHAYLMSGSMDLFKRAVYERNGNFIPLISDETHYGEILEKEYGTTNFTEVIQKEKNKGFGEFDHEIQYITKVIEKYYIYKDGYKELKNNGYLTSNGTLKDYIKKYNLNDNDNISEYKEIISQFTKKYQTELNKIDKVEDKSKKSNISSKLINNLLNVLTKKLNHIKDNNIYFYVSDNENEILFIFNKDKNLRTYIKENNIIIELKYSEKGLEQNKRQRMPNGTRKISNSLKNN